MLGSWLVWFLLIDFITQYLIITSPMDIKFHLMPWFFYHLQLVWICLITLFRFSLFGGHSVPFRIKELKKSNIHSGDVQNSHHTKLNHQNMTHNIFSSVFLKCNFTRFGLIFFESTQFHNLILLHVLIFRFVYLFKMNVWIKYF